MEQYCLSLGPRHPKSAAAMLAAAAAYERTRQPLMALGLRVTAAAIRAAAADADAEGAGDGAAPAAPASAAAAGLTPPSGTAVGRAWGLSEAEGLRQQQKVPPSQHKFENFLNCVLPPRTLMIS